MWIFIVPFFISILCVAIEFIGFLCNGKSYLPTVYLRISEFFVMIAAPVFYLWVMNGETNDCCGDSAFFSPDHRLTMWVLIVLSVIAYFYSSFRKAIAPPIVEVVVNALLLICIVLNVFVAIHVEEGVLYGLGNIPIILYSIIALVKNQQLFVESNSDTIPANPFEMFAWRILRLNPLLKFPIIFILCLPVLVLLTAILMLVGQKPDSIVRAFTDTYKHGLSQWDYKCDNVVCGGHYLCSVAANGHKMIVKPQRYGVRAGGTIICNRQLLVSNAFEELLQEQLPLVHKIIRKNYDIVGDMVHRHYHFFNIKLVSDIVYVLMKPLEWFFLTYLYTFDKKPENRIAKQYISNAERQVLNGLQ